MPKSTINTIRSLQKSFSFSTQVASQISDVRVVALTGGPCGGKTSALAALASRIPHTVLKNNQINAKEMVCNAIQTCRNNDVLCTLLMVYKIQNTDDDNKGKEKKKEKDNVILLPRS